MPWCDSCSAYHAPTALDGGSCPSCGGVVTDNSPPTHEEDEVRTVGQSAPWHFWIVVVALAAYLIWRAVIGVIWAIERFG